MNRPTSPLLWKADSGSQIPDERDHGQDGVRRSRKVHVDIRLSFRIDIISAKHTGRRPSDQDEDRWVDTERDNQKHVSVSMLFEHDTDDDTDASTHWINIIASLPFILISQLLVSSERFTSWLYWKFLSVNRSWSSIESIRARDLEILFNQRQSLYSWDTDGRRRTHLIWIYNWERILSWELNRPRRKKIRKSSTVISTDDIGSSSVSSRSTRRT